MRKQSFTRMAVVAFVWCLFAHGAWADLPDGTIIIVAGRPNELLAIELEGSHIPIDIHEQIITWATNLL